MIFLIPDFILNLLPIDLLRLFFPFGELPPNEMQLPRLIPPEIVIVEDEHLFIALTLAEVVHVELPHEALELGVPEVQRQDLALEKGDAVDAEGPAAVIPL